jgi:hypothetical protein
VGLGSPVGMGAAVAVAVAGTPLHAARKTIHRQKSRGNFISHQSLCKSIGFLVDQTSLIGV